MVPRSREPRQMGMVMPHMRHRVASGEGQTVQVSAMQEVVDDIPG